MELLTHTITPVYSFVPTVSRTVHITHIPHTTHITFSNLRTAADTPASAILRFHERKAMANTPELPQGDGTSSVSLLQPWKSMSTQPHSALLLWHSSPEPTQQRRFKASDQHLIRKSVTCFCSLSLLMALSHSHMTFLQSALKTILSHKAGQKSHTDAS